ncbi:MAG: hypothetical protein ABI650_11805 [Dokdonella sp.]
MLVVLPDDLDTLDGKAFVDAVPALERLARGGRKDALRVLFRNLRGCDDYRPQSDEAIRKSAQERYLHQVEMNKHGTRCPGGADFECAPEAWRDQLILYATEQRERCALVTPRMLDNRLELSRLALARGARSIVLMLATQSDFLQKQPERMRNAHQLLALRRDLTDAVQQLVAACDRQVMQRAAFGLYRQSPILALDPAAAIAYGTAYVASSPDQNTGDTTMAQVIADAAAQLPSAAVDQARQRGLQIVADHCTPR